MAVKFVSAAALRLSLMAALMAAALALAPNLIGAPRAQAAPGQPLPPPAIDAPAGAGLETAIVSGGCFWGVQGVFEHVKGVTQAISGYDGGPRGAAIYEIVSTGATGHAESVKIVFDPRQITYGQILRVFFSVATDPTQVNAQYPDSGTQYRSEIWTANAAQKRVAQAYIAQLNAAHAFTKPIATRVDDDKGFYRAEAHHQDFLARHPAHPYIALYDLPKVAALKREFPALYRDKPVLTAATS
jgi:peptide-methionine (S)-S-oxide reductase